MFICLKLFYILGKKALRETVKCCLSRHWKTSVILLLLLCKCLIFFNSEYSIIGLLFDFQTNNGSYILLSQLISSHCSRLWATVLLNVRHIPDIPPFTDPWNSLCLNNMLHHWVMADSLKAKSSLLLLILNKATIFQWTLF